MKILHKYLSFFRKKDFNDKEIMNFADFRDILTMKFLFVFTALAIFCLIPAGKETLHQVGGKTSLLHTYISAVILAPILEELLFRLPLLIVSKIFKNYAYVVMFAFFFTSLIFGLVHITNYKNFSQYNFLQVFLFTLPQIFTGFIVGWVCLKYKGGLFWGMLLHASYNFIIITLTALF